VSPAARTPTARIWTCSCAFPEGTGLLALGRFTQELEELLHVPVDVVPDDSVKPRVRSNIERDLVPL
jgi:predicted nucleotidyltransferase